MGHKRLKTAELSDEQFEEMLCKAVNEAFEKEMTALPPDEELRKMYPPSERHKRRMAKLLGPRPKPFYGYGRKLLKVAAALVLLVGMTSGLFLLNADVRAAVGNQLIQWHSQFVRFAFYSEERDSLDDVESSRWQVTYIPDGFVESERMDMGAVVVLMYENEAGATIFLNIKPADGAATAVDNENTVYSTAERDGVTFHVFAAIREGDSSAIVWGSRGTAFLLLGEVDPNTLLDMAFSVEVTE